jgi:hypothetical protein
MWPILLISRLRSSAYQLCSLAAAVLSFFVIDNLTESSIFDGDQVLQVFVTLIIASLVTALRRLGRRKTVGKAAGIGSSRRSSLLIESASLDTSNQNEDSPYTRNGFVVMRRTRGKPINL